MVPTQPKPGKGFQTGFARLNRMLATSGIDGFAKSRIWSIDVIPSKAGA